jgi:hypothetical protein
MRSFLAHLRSIQKSWRHFLGRITYYFHKLQEQLEGKGKNSTTFLLKIFLTIEQQLSL